MKRQKSQVKLVIFDFIELELMPGFMEFLHQARDEDIELRLTSSYTFGAVIREAMDRSSSLALYHSQYKLQTILEWANTKSASKSAWKERFASGHQSC